MKTTTEIIEETVQFYLNNPRSVDEEGKCKYNGPNGIKCAFSRCCKDDIDFSEFEGENCNPFLKFLKEEYSIHTPWGFWSDIQSLHDEKTNWIEESPQASTRQLSDKGTGEVKRLKDKAYDFNS